MPSQSNTAHNGLWHDANIKNASMIIFVNHLFFYLEVPSVIELCLVVLTTDIHHDCSVWIQCYIQNIWWYKYLYPRPTKLEGGILDSPCPSVRPSVRPSVCRRHGFRSISQVCFGISISNFICMLMVAISRSLLIFSDVTSKMAAWRPYWIFWFPDSNFTLALNINFKLMRHNTYVYG